LRTSLREAFKKYLQKTYAIFHMLVDHPSSLLTYGKSATFFTSLKRHFYIFPLKDQKYFKNFNLGLVRGGEVKMLKMA